jgi:hypothetical protein
MTSVTEVYLIFWEPTVECVPAHGLCYGLCRVQFRHTGVQQLALGEILSTKRECGIRGLPAENAEQYVTTEDVGKK